MVLIVLSPAAGGGGAPPSSLPYFHHHADIAPPNVLPLLRAVRHCGGGAVRGRGAFPDTSQPEAVDVGKVVAGSSWPLTLHKGLGPEVRQTAA